MGSKKVLVGMSGGVDSSVAAWLLKEQGYDVTGVTMQMHPGGDPSDAARVAEAIGIPHRVLDFQEEFRRDVMNYFIAEYTRGRTPNPCIVCNRRVKWEALLEYGREMGAEYIATGHYARVVKLPNGRMTVRKSASAAKDQTYVLYQLTQEQLGRTLMPLGEYVKEDIRRMAEEQDLPVAHKPDSQEICFIPDNDYARFLLENGGVRAKEGNFVDAAGRILGRHKGIIHYTVGQRKGLGIAFGHPVFVKEIRPETDEVVLGENDEVFSSRLLCEDLNWMAVEGLLPGEELTADIKIRYSHRGEKARVRMLPDGRAECLFEKPVRAATPGQAAVFYDGDDILGGGTICRE